MAKNDDNGRGPDNIDIEKPAKTYNTSKSNTSSRTEIDGGGGPDNIDIEKPAKTYNTSKSNTSSRTDVDGGGGPDDIDIEKPAKTYNTSKSNTKAMHDGGDGPEPQMAKTYNTSKSNTSSRTDVDGGGGPDDIDIEKPAKTYNTSKSNTKAMHDGGDGPDPQMAKTYNTSKSNTSSRTEIDGGNGGGGSDSSAVAEELSGVSDNGGGGDGPDPQMIKNYNSSKSNTSAVKDGDGDGPDDLKESGGGCSKCGLNTCRCHCSCNREQSCLKCNPDGNEATDGGNGGGGGDSSAVAEELSGVSDNGGGGDGPDPQMIKNYNSSKSNTSAVKSGGEGSRRSRRVTVMDQGITSAVKVITAALLLVTVAAGADIYQTYNDAIEIDLEKHITDADFEMSDDKSEISGTVGFDIPEMGMFEKSIIASVHVTVLESNPTTDGDYEFEYTLGSGEHFYDFTLDDLDPVTVEKIEAGQPLDIEYSGTISVTYLGIEIPSVTMDIPLTTTTVETA